MVHCALQLGMQWQCWIACKMHSICPTKPLNSTEMGLSFDVNNAASPHLLGCVCLTCCNGASGTLSNTRLLQVQHVSTAVHSVSVHRSQSCTLLYLVHKCHDSWDEGLPPLYFDAAKWQSS
jgi:hypothetical protein